LERYDGLIKGCTYIVDSGDSISNRAKNYMAGMIDEIERVDKKIQKPSTEITGKYKREQVALLAKYKFTMN